MNSLSVFVVVAGKQYALKGMIDYIFDDQRHSESIVDFGCLYVTPWNIVEDMLLTKVYCNNMNGNEYEQIILSLEGHEYKGDPSIDEYFENTHIVAACAMFREIAYVIQAHARAQLVYAVHADTENLHAHYVINSVRLDNGLKVQLNKKALLDLKADVNKVLEARGFSLIRSRADVNNYFAIVD